jgi:hypothetical protein
VYRILLQVILHIFFVDNLTNKGMGNAPLGSARISTTIWHDINKPRTYVEALIKIIKSAHKLQDIQFLASSMKAVVFQGLATL